MAETTISLLPATETLLDADVFPVDHTVTSTLGTYKVTWGDIKDLLAYQPLNENLTELSESSLTEVGKRFLALGVPDETPSYSKVDLDGIVDYLTPAEVLEDIGAQVHDEALDELSLINPTPTGKNFLTIPASVIGGFVKAGAASPDVNDESVSALSYRTASQVLSDIAAMPAAYLSTDSTMHGGSASDARVPSELAVRNFVNARGGIDAGEPTDTIASFGSIDLTDITDQVLTVTGNTDISEILMNEGQSMVLIFEQALDVKASASLITPGGEDRPVKPDSYVVVTGKPDDVTDITLYQEGNSKALDVIGPLFIKQNDTDFGVLIDVDGNILSENIQISLIANADSILNLSGNLTIGAGGLSVAGAGAVKIYSGAGSPEGAVTATVGSLYTRTNGGVDTTLYVKESGAGNTGWQPK